MRCFEAMGCGALLLSDEGNYPEGMDGHQTISTYESGTDCFARIEDSLNNWVETKEKADRGRGKKAICIVRNANGFFLKGCWSDFRSALCPSADCASAYLQLGVHG